jgi:uncharacterized SAM-binding protein YcdF (DUF218 family)
MKKLKILAGVCLACGLGLVLAPVHMQMTGLVLLLLGAAVALWTRLSRKMVGQVLAICAAAGVILLMAAMNLITCFGHTDWETARQAEYAVVLGASVRQDGEASRIMRQRLTAALEFMEENPDAKVILSGGQGDDEPMTEAQCMYDTLVSLGADPSRLILEPGSSTTRENLQNSQNIIEGLGGTDRPIALITSEFHQRRAANIGKNLGLATCPVSAHTDQWFYRVNYTLREVFAFIKAAALVSMD